MKTARDPAVRTSGGSSFHHLGARTEKSPDAYFPCSSRDHSSSAGGSKERSAVQGVISALSYVGAGLFLALETSVSVFRSGSYGKPVEGVYDGVVWENLRRLKVMYLHSGSVTVINRQ